MDQAGERNAVVLLSGGLDSATALACAARRDRFQCHALSFDYGQRHRFELQAAERVARFLQAVEHKIVQIDLRAFGGSALTDDAIAVPKIGDEPPPAQTPPSSPRGEGSEAIPVTIPVTYVPARNTIFLSFALAYAEVIDASDIYIGINAIDYSGYPDCRPEYIEAFERMANLATKAAVEGAHYRVRAPLINLTKAQIIALGTALGVDYALTLSCYDPIDLGGGRWRPCRRCDSCRLRAAGFAEAGVVDPALASN